jgi:hypothetical protein
MAGLLTETAKGPLPFCNLLKASPLRRFVKELLACLSRWPAKKVRMEVSFGTIFILIRLIKKLYKNVLF